MKTLASLIEDYNKTLSEEFKQEIIDFVFDTNNLHLFNDIFVYRDYAEWVDYGTGLKLKRLAHGKYLVTEVFNFGNGYMCYCYRIELENYSSRALEEYRKNCAEYKHSSPDDEFFSAAAVASAFTVENANDLCVVADLFELEAWYAKIEKEYA